MNPSQVSPSGNSPPESPVGTTPNSQNEGTSVDDAVTSQVANTVYVDTYSDSQPQGQIVEPPVMDWADVFNEDFIQDVPPEYNFNEAPNFCPSMNWELPSLTSDAVSSTEQSSTLPEYSSVVNWDTLVNDAKEYASLPPAYSALEPVAQPEDYALSPNTMKQLTEFLQTYPNVSFVNGEWMMPTPIDNGIDPSLIFSKPNTDHHDGDDAASAIAIQPTAPIALDNSDINDPNAAVLAALSSDEELLQALDDSSDEEECLELDMIVRHLWVGHNIKYIVRTAERTYRLTAEQLQERFAGTRQTLWKYWEAKRGGNKIPARLIRRHLRKMGISGFFREMLWHLLSPGEYRKLLLLRKQGALHLWQW